MKVVFLKSHGRHRPGQIAEVAHGFAQNFLMPRGIAVAATPAAVQSAAAAMRAAQRQQDAVQAQRQQLLTALEGQVVRTPAPAASSGTLYAAVTPQVIRQAIVAQLHIQVPETFGAGEKPVKVVGRHELTWHLDDRTVTFTVEV